MITSLQGFCLDFLWFHLTTKNVQHEKGPRRKDWKWWLNFDHHQLSSGGKLLSLILAYTRSKEYLEKYLNLSSLILMKSNLISKNKRMWRFLPQWDCDVMTMFELRKWMKKPRKEPDVVWRTAIKTGVAVEEAWPGVFVQLSGIIWHDPHSANMNNYHHITQ